MNRTLLAIFLLLFATIVYLHLNNQPQKKESPYKVYANLIPKTYRIGFTNLEKEIHIDKLPIIGIVPKWLSGTLFRNGPAKFTSNGFWVSNWFDGLAMIHAFSFKEGNVSYTNKFLRTTDYEFVQKTGKMSYGGFAQDPCKSIFKSLFSWFVSNESKERMPNANVNIAVYTNHFIALTETPLPVEFDPKTLDTIGVLRYNDQLPQSRIHDTAHPHYDKNRSEHLGYFTKFGKKSSYNLFSIKDGTTTRKIIASYEVDLPSYMHSFAITDKYAILTALPLVVNPLDLLLKQQAFIKNFKWKPELGTQFIVIDRINNKVIGSYKSEPFFAFHTVNAFEENNNIVIDIVVYPDSSRIMQANFDSLLGVKNSTHKEASLEPDVDTFEHATLIRFKINLDSGKIDSKILANELIELPRINYDHFNGKPYKYVYAYAKDKDLSEYVATKLVKINIETGQLKQWIEKNCYPGEPVFVACPNCKEEDDGIILSVVLDSEKETSFLLILDAKNFEEIARAEVPHHIPFGIHGIFV